MTPGVGEGWHVGAGGRRLQERSRCLPLPCGQWALGVWGTARLQAGAQRLSSTVHEPGQPACRTDPTRVRGDHKWVVSRRAMWWEVPRKDHSDHLAETRPWRGRGQGRRRQTGSGMLVEVEEGEKRWLDLEANWRQTGLPSRWQRGARLSPKLLTKQTGGWRRCWLKTGERGRKRSGWEARAAWAREVCDPAGMSREDTGGRAVWTLYMGAG